MAIDWDSVQESAGGNYKNYADDGNYTVKCTGVEIKEVGQNGSVIMKFEFEETDVQFPTADHWLTFKEGKESFRQWHSKCLMVVLGASEDAARKAVEMCESKNGKENIMKAYEQTFNKLTSKKPEVDIEVYTEGDYARAEFKDRSVAFSRNSNTQAKKTDEGILSQGEEVELNDLPF